MGGGGILSLRLSYDEKMLLENIIKKPLFKEIGNYGELALNGLDIQTPI